MKKSIAKIYNMLVVVEDFLASNGVIVDSIEGLKVMFLLFAGKVKVLKKMNQALEELPEKPAQTKQKIEAELDKLVDFYSRKIVAYAVITNNPDLEQKVSLNASGLTRKDDKSKLAFARILFETSEPILAALAPHSINADTQLALKSTTDAFEKAIPQTRETTSAGSTTLEDFEELIKESNTLLTKKMDKLVNGADDDKAEFVSNYFKNRKQINLPSSTISLLGTIKDKDGNPIQGVEIKLDKQIFKSTKKGNFRIPNKDAGVYKLIFSKPGFISKTVDIVIGGAGERTSVNIVLDKI